jgi:uncharacterized protein YndB with AHSA1/START domain
MRKYLEMPEHAPHTSEDDAAAPPVEQLDVAETSALEPRDDAFPANVEQLEEELPRLYSPGARTIARDRWERMVTEHVYPATPEEIWSALTDPAALKEWLVECRGSLERVHSDCVLDFGDGDFFLCRPMAVRRPHYLEWRWRWLGIGPVWSVKWYLKEVEGGTRVVVVDEALNPPARTGHYRGEGWPEILDMLATYLRTKSSARWGCRSQSFVLVDLPVTLYGAWDRLFSPAGLKWWLHGFHGQLAPGQSVVIHIGDASGSVELSVREVVPPSYNVYPFVAFAMKRPFWPHEVPGRLFLEPAGWGRSILQVYQTDWENLGPALHRAERPLIVSFWSEAMRRASLLCSAQGVPAKASPWVLSELEPTDRPAAWGEP